MGPSPSAGHDDLLWRPMLNAAVIAVCYGFVGIAYIQVSDRIAAAIARDVATLAFVQEVKGVAFILGTALLLFGFSFLLFRRVYRGMLDALRTQAALLAAERKASAAMMSLCMAHDINNQLQVLRSIAYLIESRRERLGDEGEQLVTGLNGSIDKLDAMLSDMRAGGRRSAATEIMPVELADFVAESLRFIGRHHRVRHCRVDVVPRVRPSLTVCPGVLHDALLNLVLNAGEAVEGNGDIRIAIVPAPGGAAIEVHDSGPGVPAQVQATLFQAFHTTKPEGTGLGLLSVKACAELHGGEVAYERSPLGGACFRMTLHSLAAPGTAPDAAWAAAADSGVVTPQGTRLP